MIVEQGWGVGHRGEPDGRDTSLAQIPGQVLLVSWSNINFADSNPNEYLSRILICYGVPQKIVIIKSQEGDWMLGIGRNPIQELKPVVDGSDKFLLFLGLI